MNDQPAKPRAWRDAAIHGPVTLLIAVALPFVALVIRYGRPRWFAADPEAPEPARWSWRPWDDAAPQVHWIAFSVIACAMVLAALGGRTGRRATALRAAVWLVPVVTGFVAYAARLRMTLATYTDVADDRRAASTWLADLGHIRGEATSEALSNAIIGLYASAGLALATLVLVALARRRDRSGAKAPLAIAAGAALVAIAVRAASRDFVMLPLHAMVDVLAIATLLLWRLWTDRRGTPLASILVSAAALVLLVGVAGATVDAAERLGAVSNEAVDDEQRLRLLGTLNWHPALDAAVDVGAVVAAAFAIFRADATRSLRDLGSGAWTAMVSCVAGVVIACLVIDRRVDARLLEHSMVARIYALPIELPVTACPFESRDGPVVVIAPDHPPARIEPYTNGQTSLAGSWPLVAADRRLPWAKLRDAVRAVAPEAHLLVHDRAGLTPTRLGTKGVFVDGALGTLPVRFAPDPSTWDSVPASLPYPPDATVIGVVTDGSDDVRWRRLGRPGERAHLSDPARPWQRECVKYRLCHLVLGVDEADTLETIVARIEQLAPGLDFTLNARGYNESHWRLVVLADRADVERAVAKPVVGVERIRSDAEKMASFVESDLARGYLRATEDLPEVATRTVRWSNADHTIDEEAYYTPPQYGYVLAYARPLDLVARALEPSAPASLGGYKIFDFGYGGIGHLLLFARLGAQAVGVDVDEKLALIYPHHQEIGIGSVTLLNGRFPADRSIADAAGSGFDLVISKNTLKNGYIHPAEEVSERMRIDLGVTDEAFVRTVFERLKPHGLFMIYNICPAPAPPGKPYLPYADGRSPFSKALYEKAGFDVLVIDRDDTERVRAMARILGWDTGPEKSDIEHDLFAMYTLVRRP